MLRSTGFIGTLLCAWLATAAHAEIVLNFRDPTPAGPDAGTAGETLETGAPFTVSGLTVTATPTGTSLAGDGLLANNDSFGVDSNSFGGFTDVADDIQFDGGESLAISFDQTVEITEVDLQGLVGAEAGRVTAGSFSIDLLTGVSGFNGSSDVFTPAAPILVPEGTPVVFEAVAAGGAFGLQGLTVNVVATVPEPGAIAIWCLLACIGFAIVLRRSVATA